MGTSGNVLTRLGLQTQPQNQNQGSGSPPEQNGWFGRLFQREEIPPPPPPKPPGADETFKMGAWDRITIGNRTLEDIANTMYNEDRGLRGELYRTGINSLPFIGTISTWPGKHYVKITTELIP